MLDAPGGTAELVGIAAPFAGGTFTGVVGIERDPSTDEPATEPATDTATDQ